MSFFSGVLFACSSTEENCDLFEMHQVWHSFCLALRLINVKEFLVKHGSWVLELNSHILNNCGIIDILTNKELVTDIWFERIFREWWKNIIGSCLFEIIFFPPTLLENVIQPRRLSVRLSRRRRNGYVLSHIDRTASNDSPF